MAISRFTQSPTSNLTAFKAWLDSHKAGTFLENVTIALSQTTSADDTITFSDDSAQIQYTARQASSFTVISYTADSTNFTYNSGTTLSDSNARIANAILCDNGIIFNLYGKASSGGATAYSSGFAITTDEKGKLALLVNPTPIISMTPYASWAAIASSSYTSAVIPSVPAFGMNQTSFAPIVALGDDDARLPHAFAAISTELTERGIERLEIDGSDYITNGVWYIKDGE